MSNTSIGDRSVAGESGSSANPASPRQPANSGNPANPGGLSREVHTLTKVIKQLEEQLDQMMATNEALRKDLHDERARRLALEERVDELRESVRRSERQAADRDNLLTEVKHVNQERARVTASARELGERCKELVTQQEADAKKIERLRVAHADAIEEVQSVEAQFERAMQVIAQTRAQLTIAAEERDQQGLRAKTSEASLSDLRQERDALVAEVEQSRAALDEIRQSLADEFASRDDEAPRGASVAGTQESR
jgi:chromosome segregation ATPase